MYEYLCGVFPARRGTALYIECLYSLYHIFPHFWKQNMPNFCTARGKNSPTSRRCAWRSRLRPTGSQEPTRASLLSPSTFVSTHLMVRFGPVPALLDQFRGPLGWPHTLPSTFAWVLLMQPEDTQSQTPSCKTSPTYDHAPRGMSLPGLCLPAAFVAHCQPASVHPIPGCTLQLF